MADGTVKAFAGGAETIHQEHHHRHLRHLHSNLRAVLVPSSGTL